MNKNFLTLAALGLFMTITAPTRAEDSPKTATPPAPAPMKGMGMGMRHGMHGMMAGMTEEQRDKHMRAMQDHMLKMHDLSNQILAEKDPAKKEQLKVQQLQVMKSHHAEMMESHHPMQDSKTPESKSK